MKPSPQRNPISVETAHAEQDLASAERIRRKKEEDELNKELAAKECERMKAKHRLHEAILRKEYEQERHTLKAMVLHHALVHGALIVGILITTLVETCVYHPGTPKRNAQPTTAITKHEPFRS